MYNLLLDTFLIVAKEGSFTRAARRLYISHTAVMKQINNLEDQLGVKLFHRGSRGLTLTSAGQQLQKELPTYIQYSNELLRKIQNKEQITLRIGISPLYPADRFFDLWRRDGNSSVKLQVVPFADDFVQGLATDFDFFIGAFDDQRIINDMLFYQLGVYHLGFEVPVEHPLVDHRQITVADLRSQKVMLLKAGISPANDHIRSYLVNHVRNLHLVDVPERYSFDTFNDCVEQNCLLLAPDCWQKIQPSLKFIPFAKQFDLPYGIVTNQDNLRLINRMKELVGRSSQTK